MIGPRIFEIIFNEYEYGFNRNGGGMRSKHGSTGLNGRGTLGGSVTSKVSIINTGGAEPVRTQLVTGHTPPSSECTRLKLTLLVGAQAARLHLVAPSQAVFEKSS